jgi:hypothetical protein
LFEVFDRNLVILDGDSSEQDRVGFISKKYVSELWAKRLIWIIAFMSRRDDAWNLRVFPEKVDQMEVSITSSSF